jgi:hypothetical protein
MYKMFLRWHVFAKGELCHDYQKRMINSEVFKQVNFGIPTGNFRYYNRVLKSTFKMRCSIRDFFSDKKFELSDGVSTVGPKSNFANSFSWFS